MVEVRRSEDNGFSWHVSVNALGVYVRTFDGNPINISVQDARDIAHAILELTE